MGSISTRRGDGGDTSTSGGGPRVSKSDLRVEAYGTIDEANTALGLARSLCNDPAINALAKSIQRDLFAVGSAVSTKPESKKEIPEISAAMIARLDAIVDELEAVPGMLRDWSISGEMAASAGFDHARTVARRAERATVRFVTAGGELQANVLAYLNRLSDVCWLFARKLERDAGVDARLRDERHPGPPWSRAW